MCDARLLRHNSFTAGLRREERAFLAAALGMGDLLMVLASWFTHKVSDKLDLRSCTSLSMEPSAGAGSSLEHQSSV
jgi:hypothetical protein